MDIANDWKGRLGNIWAAQHRATDRMLAGVADLAIAALAPRQGERILDLGCGAGYTSLALGEAVGPAGRVTGIDISADLLAIARARAANRRELAFIEADAQTHGFAPGGFDALFSRLGCMFFTDPPAAYANIRTALRPGARVVLAAFAEPAANPWAMIPLGAAVPVLGAPVPPPPGLPGPFAWQDPDIFVPILESTGFCDLQWQAHDLEFAIGLGEDPDPAARAIAMITSIGVLARRLAEAPEGSRARLTPLLRDALTPHIRDGWVRLGARIRLIRATA